MTDSEILDWIERHSRVVLLSALNDGSAELQFQIEVSIGPREACRNTSLRALITAAAAREE